MKQKFSFYLIVVVLLMLVFPLTSIAIVHVVFMVPISWGLIGKWFVFWVVGVRLFTAGIRQVLKPAFTAQEIFHIKTVQLSC